MLLTSHSCIFSTGDVAAFSLYLLLQTHPVKRQCEDQRKSRDETDGSALEGGRSSELVSPGGKNGPRHSRLQTDVLLLIWLGWLETLLLILGSDFYSCPGRGVVQPRRGCFLPCQLV